MNRPRTWREILFIESLRNQERRNPRPPRYICVPRIATILARVLEEFQIFWIEFFAEENKVAFERSPTRFVNNDGTIKQGGRMPMSHEIYGIRVPKKDARRNSRDYQFCKPRYLR